MAKKFSQKKIKLINRVTWIAAALTAISFTIIANVINTQEKNLLKDGLREEVVVVKKYNIGTRKSPQYAMDVDWFEVIKETPLHQPKDTTKLSKAEKLSEEALSVLFKDRSRKQIKRHNKTVRLNYINGNSYNSLSKGDIITLVYYKDNPKDGRLLREIE